MAPEDANAASTPAKHIGDVPLAISPLILLRSITSSGHLPYLSPPCCTLHLPML